MSTPLAIGVVCFATLGGSGVVATELAVGLARRGHEVHLLASARPPRIAAHERLTFHEVRVPGYPLLEQAPYDLAVASALVELARRVRLDVLHVHYAVPHAASGILARQALGPGAPRLVTSLHGTDVTRLGSDPSYRAVTSFAVAASDGVTTPSDWLRREARARLALPDDLPIEVLPNFVDADRFAPAARPDRARLDALFPVVTRPAGAGPVLFHVSNFRPVKRVVDLVEVLARVRRDLPAARLVAVGDGPERPAAERRAAELGLADAIRFLGRRADFADVLRHADGFLLPSESESFGVAALEALASGVPVFAYDVGGLPEVVPATAGRLVPPYDVDALARAVTVALAGDGPHEAMRRAARAHVVAHFQLEPALDRTEDYLHRIAAMPPHRP